MNIHGCWNICPFPGNVLALKAFDSFNLEGFQAMASEFRLAASSFKHGPWVSIIDIRKFGLATPEVEPEGIVLNQWAIANGCILEVNITSNWVQDRQLNNTRAKQQKPIYKRVSVATLEDAIARATAEGFDSDWPQITDWFTRKQVITHRSNG